MAPQVTGLGDPMITEQMSEADISIAEGTSRFPSMTYEEGVSAALRWVIGETDDPPMEE